MIIGVHTYLVYYLLRQGTGGRSDVISNTAFCAIAGSAPHMAIQFGMGVLSEWRPGFGVAGCVGIVLVGPHIEWPEQGSGSEGFELGDADFPA